VGLYGQMDYIIGSNILNCSFRYKTSLDNILNLHFQHARDINSYCRANVNSSAFLSSLIEFVQCRPRDGSLSLSSSEFNMAEISSMINYICTSQYLMI